MTNFYEAQLLRDAHELGRLAGLAGWQSSQTESQMLDLANRLLGALIAHTKVDRTKVDIAYEAGSAQGRAEAAAAAEG